jgi:selenocysteine lyase/cysteine desulfurase
MTIEGQDPYEFVDRLQAEDAIVASVTPYAESYLRFATSIVTSEDDVDAAIDAVKRLARSV